MLYSVYCRDKEDTAALREKHLAVHRAHLDAWKDKIFFSGPLQSDDATLAHGSLFVLNVEDRAEAERFIFTEVFYNAGVFADVTIRRMRKGYYNPALIEGL
ncbi:YciI family protein [Paracoccus pantotrophus]|uniref:YciI family protein n=1 Tax=Paracoccus pantotrophus TaxID=82367 RepID=A0A7H9BPP8_PARPN|nr:YciI family protein [Paracoccus pantotrophus]QLH13003.1 YciI family protein [Paracoccus pantotrophus]